VSPSDEFIELYNAGDLPVHLLGWILDDSEGAGSKPFVIADTVLQAHAFLAFFRSRTHVALNDTGIPFACSARQRVRRPIAY
jgi:hypothetical protein